MISPHLAINARARNPTAECVVVMCGVRLQVQVSMAPCRILYSRATKAKTKNVYSHHMRISCTYTH